MASADVLPPSFLAPTFSPLDAITSSKRKRTAIDDMSNPLARLASLETPEKVAFDASKHLNFTPPSRTYTMAEIGLQDRGISPVAVSEPFPLFTEAAIQQMRAEVFSKKVLENCHYSSNIIKSQLRGYAADYAPFVYDAWRNPEVLSIISKVAGIDLVPEMDFEIAHINLSFATEGGASRPQEDDRPIVDWHTDSYPFVCVLMLSNCDGMIGGETALRKGNGEVMRVRGPGMGNGVILQGRYIEHQALRAFGTAERITMVTSFRPKSVFIKDDSILTTVRPVSNLSELYSQYAEYRLEMLEERIRAHLKEIRERKRSRRAFDTVSSKEFLGEQENFLAITNRELVDEEKVTKGFLDGESHLLSADLKNQSKKRARHHK